MVVVAVGEQYRFDFVLILFQILDIRNDVIHARRGFFRELNADVHDDYLVLIFEEGAIAAHFLESAQRHEAHRVVVFNGGFSALMPGHTIWIWGMVVRLDDLRRIPLDLELSL